MVFIDSLVQFVESIVKAPFNCAHCNRTLKESEKFYKVFFGEKELMSVCELCKGGYLALMREGVGKTYTTHFSYFAKKELLDVIGNTPLPEDIKKQLFEAIEDYGKGKFLESLRSIGFVGEWLTNRLFENLYGKEELQKALRWDNRLSKLANDVKIQKEDSPTIVCVHLIFALKYLRNLVSHPDSEYVNLGLKHKTLSEDVRIGIMIMIYCIDRLSMFIS